MSVGQEIDRDTADSTLSNCSMTWIRIATTGQLRDDEMMLIQLDGHQLVLYRSGADRF